MKSLSAVLILFIVTALAVPVSAQDASLYEVISTQRINVRVCPRLDCAVIQTLDPGQTVMVIDTAVGDAVRGSDQWYVIDLNGGEAYVHSSLVRKAAEPEASSGTSTDTEALDTSYWNKISGDGFTFLIPPGWADITALLEDATVLDKTAELTGQDPDAVRELVEQMLSQGLVLVSGSNNQIQLLATPLELTGNTARQTWLAIRSDIELRLGIIKGDAILDLPAGEARRMRVAVTNATPDWINGSELIIYMVSKGTHAFFMFFFNPYGPSNSREKTLFDSIAGTLTLNFANV